MTKKEPITLLAFTSKLRYRRRKNRQSKPGGGNSHMKQTGMLVVSLRGVNFGFWSRLGCSGQSANILSHQGQNLLKPRPDGLL